MGRITTVIFDMYGTLVKNPLDGWRDGFEAIIQEQGLETSSDRLWQEWSAANSDFRSSRVRPEAPFRTYYQAWRDSFGRAFASLGVPGDPGGAACSFIGFLSKRDPYPETVEAVRAVQGGWRDRRAVQRRR